jgi:hypothetical protein
MGFLCQQILVDAIPFENIHGTGEIKILPEN